MTISDFVADVRAATPSNAAELAVPDQDALRQMLDGYSAAITNAMSRQIKAAQQHLKVLSESPALKSPESYLFQRKQALMLLRNRLTSVQEQQLNRKMKYFVAVTAKLDAMSPLKVLSRGYAMAQRTDGKLIRSIDDVAVGDNLHLTLGDGSLKVTVNSLKENVHE